MAGCLAFAATALVAASSGATGPDAPELLPPWVVSESRLRPDVGGIRASAWLGGEIWSGRPVLTLADAFRHIPGAVMQESFGGFEPPRLSIRGSGVQSAPTSRGLLLRLDDLPLGLADGSFNSALFDPQLGASISVQRGLDGWRNAPATMGGALDLRSHALAEPPSAILRVEAGSFAAWRGRGTFAGRRDKANGRLSVGRTTQDGYRDLSAQSRTAALGTIELAPRADLRVTGGVYHASARYEVPGPLTLAMATVAPRSVSAEVRRDRPARDSALTRAHVRAVSRHPAAEFELGAAWAHTADDFRQLQPNGISQSRSDDASVHAVLARRFVTGMVPHELRLLGDAIRGWRDIRRYHNQAGERGAAFAVDRVNPVTATIALEDTFALSRRLTGTVGIAQVAARRDIDARAGALFRWRRSRTLPQASVRWNIDRDTAIFAGISSSAEAPAYDDLITVAGSHPSLRRAVNPLAGQRATTSEIGLRGRVRRLAWDLTAYDAHWRNEILRLADAQGEPLGAVNADRTRHQGIEAAARWLLYERGVRLTLAASTTVNRFRFDAHPVYGDGRLAGMPPNLGYADLILETPVGVFAGAGVDWTHGRTLVDHAGRLGYGGRGLGHIRVGRAAPGWTVFIEVRNVFNRAAIASTAGVLDFARNPAATAIFLPAPGRSVNVGFEWKR